MTKEIICRFLKIKIRIPGVLIKAKWNLRSLKLSVTSIFIFSSPPFFLSNGFLRDRSLECDYVKSFSEVAVRRGRSAIGTEPA